jgi:tripartite-type tricarboxylate transporter receptor subunit TctC
VSKNRSHKILEDLIAYAKANPGKLKIGGVSPGGLDDFIANGFARAAGFAWTYVPYKSGSEVKAAILGGELDVYQDR